MGNEITEFKPFETNLAEFKKKYDDVVYNLDDKKENKLARSDQRSIGSIVAKLDAVHKKIKAPLKEKVDLIDGERKRIKDQLLSVQDKIKKQIKAHEQKIKDHQDALQAKVDEIINLSVFDEFATLNSVSIAERIKKLNIIEIDDSFEDRKPDAAIAKLESQEKLNIMHETALKDEKEESERLEKERQEELKRQKEREEEIKKQAKIDAENEAKRKIEEAELKAKQAEELAKRQAEEAEIKAQQAKEAAKQAEELAASRERDKIRKEQEEKERIKKEQEKQEEIKRKNTEHRSKIHLAIREDLSVNGFTDDQVKKLIQLINSNEVRHMRIEY